MSELFYSTPERRFQSSDCKALLKSLQLRRQGVPLTPTECTTSKTVTCSLRPTIAPRGELRIAGSIKAFRTSSTYCRVWGSQLNTAVEQVDVRGFWISNTVNLPPMFGLLSA